MSEEPERRVLKQDLPQYLESQRVGGTAKRREAEASQAQYESEVSQYNQEQKAAEEKYQRELAEYEKSQESKKQKETIEKKYDSMLQELESNKSRDITAARESIYGTDANAREARARAQANVEQQYKTKIAGVTREKNSVLLPILLKEQGYPQYAIDKATRAYRSGKSLTVGSAIESAERLVSGKEAQAERGRVLSAKVAQDEAARLSTAYHSQIIGKITGFGLSEGSERAGAIKSTPDVITGKQATGGRRPLTGVDTGQSIMGRQSGSPPIKITSTETYRKDPTKPASLDNPVLVKTVIREIPEKPASKGVSPKTNPTALLAGMFKQEVTPAGTKPEDKTIFSFQNVSDVKEESGRALLEFQSQLKTQTAPSAGVYKEILKERGLPLTPLSKRIIETYAEKPTKEYKTRAEAFGLEEAKGRKGIIYKQGFPIFNLETGEGSKRIGKLFGFQYGKPTYEYPKTFEGSLQYALSPKVQGPPRPKYETINAVPGSLEFAVKTSIDRPVSSSGERLEYGLKLIESEQKKYAKYNDDAGQLLHVGLGFGKDILAGAAFIENKLWEGEAVVRRGIPKTREISIPPTAFGVATEEVISGRPQMIYPKVVEYEKTYGKGSIAGEVFSLLVPLPGAKIRSPAILSENAAKIWQKTKVPQFGRMVKEKAGMFELNRNFRITKKIAESRADEGIYGIKKEGKKIFLIERGLEEQRSKIGITKAEPQLVRFTKEGKPVFTKIPKKQRIPATGKVSETPVSVVRFGEKVKGKITITDFTPPKDFPEPPKRIIIASPDIEFVRQQKSLGLTEISKGVYEMTKPTKKRLGLLKEMEKSGYLSHVATGRTTSYKLVKKEVVKTKPRTIKEMLKMSKPSKTKGEIITRPETKKPRTIKEMLKMSKEKAKPREQDIFDIIERPNITQVYETLGGLGKVKFVKDVTKTKDIIPFGSKDLERKLESVGLGEKRKIGPAKTPYNYEQLKPARGTGGSVGKAKTLSESAKNTIIKSYIPDIKKLKKEPIDYLQVRSVYIPRSSEEPTSVSGTPYSTEYITPRYPEEKINRLTTTVTPILEIKIKNDISQIPAVMQQGGQKTQLDTSLVTKQKEETLQKQKYKLDTTITTRRGLRTRQIPKVKLLAATIPDIMQSAAQPQQLKQPQRLQLKQKQLQIFRYKYPERVPRTPDTRRRPIAFWVKENKIPKSVLKKQKEKADFLGASSELQISGVFKRQDITYGQRKIAKLLKGDVRVVQGKKRASPRRATKWKEGKQGDMFGFKNEKKKRTKFF